MQSIFQGYLEKFKDFCTQSDSLNDFLPRINCFIKITRGKKMEKYLFSWESKENNSMWEPLRLPRCLQEG